MRWGESAGTREAGSATGTRRERRSVGWRTWARRWAGKWAKTWARAQAPSRWEWGRGRAPGPRATHFDPDLLRDGDRRNVVDRYRYWRLDAIVADLDTRRHGFHVAVENWGHDFNIGSVIRTANAFNAAAFHIVGRRRWNRRGAMVTDRYQHEHHHPDPAHLAGGRHRGCRRPGIPLIGIDNLPGSVPLETHDLPRECVLVFGQEGPGLSPGMRAACEVVLHIEQFGSTRSINAGAAAAVAMHAWVRRHVFRQAVD